MIVLGVLLLVLGFLLGIHLLVVVGAVLAVTGVVLWIANTAGPVNGRWY